MFPKSIRILWTRFRDVRGLVSSNIASSANKLIVCMLEPNWKPLIEVCDLMASAKGSIIRLKIVGDRGHPWRVPLFMLKGEDRKPGEYTCAKGQEYSAKCST